MIENGFILDFNNKKHAQNYLIHQALYDDNPPNVVFAHNGMKFDYRLLMEALNSKTHVNTVGDYSNLKKIITPGCMFMDSLLLITNSLANISKSFSKSI
jgi:hypothetical protein